MDRTELEAKFRTAFKIWQMAQVAQYYKIGAAEGMIKVTLEMKAEDFWVNSSLSEKLLGSMEAMAEGMERILRG